MKHLKLAISLLTIFPVNIQGELLPGDSGRSAVWFSYIGVAIGAIVFASSYLLGLIFPPTITTLLALLVWVAMTGGLHLDGVADCCDGMLHASTPQRRLEIMKDPHIGAFGVVGIIAMLLLKTASLLAIIQWPILQFGLVILLATSLSRWGILLAGLQPQARPNGMGADFSIGIQKISLIGGGLPVVLIIILLGWMGIIVASVGLAWIGIIFVFARNKIGGVTGDVFGLLVESVECIVLLSAIAIMR
jgi:adenosylcobinamide-GDP ribazoletransferase